MNKFFFILKGNNGATYILNTKNWKAISNSLKFYRAHSLKSKILKWGLRIALFVLGKLKSPKLKTIQNTNNFICEIVGFNGSFELNTNCSVLISPTQDKVIINHHNQYFQKFAFGESYGNVKKEAEIYKLFKSGTQNFQVSHFYDEQIVKDTCCSFKLSNEKLITSKKEKKRDVAVVAALTALFNHSEKNKITVVHHLETLMGKIQLTGISLDKAQFQMIKELNKEFGTICFPLGLVHRDFKPWNVLNFDKLLIYDFEEAILAGPPLEDLLNYYVDPIIRYKNTEAIAELIYSKEMNLKYSEYLDKLKVPTSFKPFLVIYVLERILFWHEAKEFDTSEKYLALLNKMTNRERNS
ncbi:hypothetical protein [Polaribacter sp. IC073]|uniref:hypothetical protein n=1 Tax=Polaribacter sp. IC073 TaxID=2508540 RepID=UPI0011BE6E33|nr:hypothetical protein [Polaribacter sp. IC073]TXD47762.1 hypothetical protein ES045_10775 [Polaribacter sp. IC073]